MVSQRERPPVPDSHDDEAEHRRELAEAVNAALMGDASRAAVGPVCLLIAFIADLPDPQTCEGGLLYVKDEAGGATIAFSDGTDWRRVQDRAVVS